MAELAGPSELVAAAQRVRAAGYERIDAYSPFPVEGLDDALGARSKGVALATLLGGLVGGGGGYFMQWYSAVVDYPLDVGGRPLHSAPSFVPITFELTILAAAFSAVLAMLALNGLPRPHHPVFAVPAFRRASCDRFFLCIDADDPCFDAETTRRLLEQVAGGEVYDVEA
jgi:hypothetical protein